MKRIIIIIAILLIFPSILSADCAWLLWEHWSPLISMKETGKWSLINALNSRNECLDALLKKHIRFYEVFLDDPSYEVSPKPDETILRCSKLFRLASKSKPVSDACKNVITHFIIGRTDIEGIKSELALKYTSEKARQIIEKARQMDEEGKNKDEIDAYLKASDFYKEISNSKYEFWCLPVGVDPKTVVNEY